MAEVYTVHVDSTTPVEITGGRVGHFRIHSPNQAYFLGGSSMSGPVYQVPPVPGAEAGVVTNGFNDNATLIDLYVTSPDEIFAVYFLRQQYGDENSPYEDHEFDLTIFHNR